MFELLQENMKDTKITTLLHDCLVEPLKGEIENGELDVPVANALARISTPIIWACVVMFTILIVMLYCSVVLLLRAS
mgnify:CR=1 FL=1